MIAPTDRELLELAAKAAGLRLWSRGAWRGTEHATGLLLASGRYLWNPLTDDGDALRLLVDLQLDIEFVNGDALVLNVAEGGPDRFTATRRAIVRAAAAIGEAMP
ncbi:hypothetical protein [Massilia antarctica]|uniref:hypothetical protein n=1 Tax=Massilia antarctica TaxID=2765360 RepID=UPI0022708A85|nr:hypothetical protein [Massilia sp. H27-R4]MCY0910898.1 hypothetical protein [Massilia sp. H27-R4]